MFLKQPQELITYKLDKTAGSCPPYEKGPYDTIDYFITRRKWRNTVKNVASNMFAGIESDHCPIVADIRISLKADYNKKTAKPQISQMLSEHSTTTYGQQFHH